MKKIVVLGSTGSIGKQTLEVVRDHADELEVIALCAGSSVDALEKQIREFKPKLAVLYDETAADDLKARVSDIDITVLGGMDGLIQAASMEDADVVLTAVVGMIGIRPTIAAINAGHDIALANKETLVCAGHIIMPLAKEKGVSILPVDSEHSAIFQSLNGEPKNRIAKIWLTCSGGPFRGFNAEQLKAVTVEDALKHPNWNMGNKITIDSASMVNKGLEIMEAAWLFGVDHKDINVLVHPQSIIHSMVEYVDGAVMAELGMPDMKLPIQYALFYPDRKASPAKKADFYEIAKLTFEKADAETFRGLKLALKAAELGGSMPTVFNAANEKAVALCLDKKIAFCEIPDIIEKAMDRHKLIENPDVEQILDAEREAYE